MTHSLKVSVSKKPLNGVVALQNVRLRERLLRYLFGELRQVTLIVPDSSMEEIEIRNLPVREGVRQ